MKDQEWDELYQGHKLHLRFDRWLLDRFQAEINLPERALILDAGCSTGGRTIQLARRGYTCVGLDISEHAIETARQSAAAGGVETRTTFLVNNIDDLPFPDGHFDAVQCMSTLMHVPQLDQAVAQLCRVLKPGGKMIIFEWSSTGLEFRLRQALRWLKRNRPQKAETQAGVEFWQEQDGRPFYCRIADPAYLENQLHEHGVETQLRIPSSFWNTGRFPPVIRDLLLGFNALWLLVDGPNGPCAGSTLIGHKT